MRIQSDAGSDFFVHFGQEPQHGRFPLQQRWRLLSGSASSLASIVLRSAEDSRSRFAIVRQGRQGYILALTELALGEARSAVRRSHWREVAFAEPRIRTLLDAGGRHALEPVMRLKVNALREHLEPVTQVLRDRGVRMLRTQHQGHYSCLLSFRTLRARCGSLNGQRRQPAPSLRAGELRTTGSVGGTSGLRLTFCGFPASSGLK